jgi:hypothetical protein
LYWRHERPEETATLKRRRRWAAAVRAEPDAHTTVRRLLALHPLESLRSLGNDAAWKRVQHYIETGWILLFEWIPERGGGGRNEDWSEPDMVAFPIEERRVAAAAAGTKPPPPPDIASFPDSADLAAIAAVMKEAAELGLPFCEECARAAAGRAA